MSRPPFSMTLAIRGWCLCDRLLFGTGPETTGRPPGGTAPLHIPQRSSAASSTTACLGGLLLSVRVSCPLAALVPWLASAWGERPRWMGFRRWGGMFPPDVLAGCCGCRGWLEGVSVRTCSACWCAGCCLHWGPCMGSRLSGLVVGRCCRGRFVPLVGCRWQSGCTCQR